MRRIAAAAWRFRFRVEREAEARFARLAVELDRIGAAADLVEQARRASAEERHHAALCAELCQDYGEPVSAAEPVVLAEIAPRGLLPRGCLLYELVAACCITETESMAVLTTLLPAARTERMRAILHRLARDEVGHSRLGWTHLAGEHGRGVTAFLGPLVPSMLAGSIDPSLFDPVPDDGDDGQLLAEGVLPRALKRRVFTETLEQVVFPGLEACGVDSGPSREWLREVEEASRIGEAGR